MGKHGFLTPKAISNRIKAKGLQKLRWYCQMCQKQCRDENGFKCHCMSESHQRQMQVFGQNPNRIIHGFSDEFETAFLDHMKHSHRFRRVPATVVYNEYIADRHHIHMNSTQWATLTEFIKYLGKTGKCKVEEMSRGWFITYINRDSDTLFNGKMKIKRLRGDTVDEDKQDREIRKQRKRAEQSIMLTNQKENNQQEEIQCQRLLAKPENEKITLILGSVLRDKPNRSRKVFDDAEDDNMTVNASNAKSVLDELMKEQEKSKEMSNRKDYWLCEGIIVKVISKTLADKGYYYKQKGVICKVIDKYVGEIKMIENKHVLRIDQQELETVIPKIGGLVKIVNGAYRGSNARLLAVDSDRFCVKVKIEKGIYDGRVLKAVEYEDICKLTQAGSVTDHLK